MDEILNSSALAEKYGFQFDPRFDCIGNTIINVARTVLNPRPGKFPEIYFHRGVDHAYILYDGHVFNAGVTARKGLYPDFSVEQLIDEAKNRTKVYLEVALMSFYNDIINDNDKEINAYNAEQDRSQIRKEMQEAFPEETLSVVVPRLRQLYQLLIYLNP